MPQEDRILTRRRPIDEHPPRPEPGGPGLVTARRTPVTLDVVAEPIVRSRAENVMRRLLSIGDKPTSVDDNGVYRMFHLSIGLSALRCLLSYVVLPIIVPALGAAGNVGPELGVPIAVIALVFDYLGIRRFWLTDHRWRWPMTGVYLVVMILVSALLVSELVRLTS